MNISKPPTMDSSLPNVFDIGFYEVIILATRPAIKGSVRRKLPQTLGTCWPFTGVSRALRPETAKNLEKSLPKPGCFKHGCPLHVFCVLREVWKEAYTTRFRKKIFWGTFSTLPGRPGAKSPKSLFSRLFWWFQAHRARETLITKALQPPTMDSISTLFSTWFLSSDPLWPQEAIKASSRKLSGKECKQLVTPKILLEFPRAGCFKHACLARSQRASDLLPIICVFLHLSASNHVQKDHVWEFQNL